MSELGFPFDFDARGLSSGAAPDEHVRQLIEQVLLTAPGERVMRPDFGSGLQSLVFEPNGSVLAAATQKLGESDLIIAATESSDGYTGTVPEQLAEVLGLPSVTFAKSVEVDGGTLKVNRQTEAGYDEVTCPLPAVVSVTAGVVEPRYPSFKGIMDAKKKPVDTVTAADLGVTPVGWAGANQEIVDVAQAPERAAGEKVVDDGDAHLKIVAFLENLKVI